MKTKLTVQKIFSILCVLILLIACCVVVVGFKTSLDDQLKEEILNAINQEQKNNNTSYQPITSFEDNYTAYGMVNGYAVYYSQGMATVITKLKVANFTFSDSSAFAITCYKDGQLVSLKDAYESKLISSFDVFVIWLRHICV